MVLENLSDVDSMALKMAVDEFKMGGVPLVYLEQYLVDVSNFVGYQTMPVALWVQLKLVRSLNSSRRRSRLTNRKPFELSATLQSIKSTPFFAKETQEFANIWRKEHNGGEIDPTPRQVLVGLSEFYKLQLEKELRGCKQARLAVVQETYRRVFETIQRLINFPDLDKKFDTDGEEYGLWMPESKACFIVLWLYSIEPPLYYFFNEACRLRNKAVVSLLGPFAAAVGIILNGNAEKKRPDTIKGGYSHPNKSSLGCMAGAFLLFRGCLLPPHAIAKFALMQGRRLYNETKIDKNGQEWGKSLDEGDYAKWRKLTAEMKR